jgi:uncharacterized membrane protein
MHRDVHNRRRHVMEIFLIVIGVILAGTALWNSLVASATYQVMLAILGYVFLGIVGVAVYLLQRLVRYTFRRHKERKKEKADKVLREHMAEQS